MIAREANWPGGDGDGDTADVQMLDRAEGGAWFHLSRLGTAGRLTG
jgi:hypothetical protein